MLTLVFSLISVYQLSLTILLLNEKATSKEVAFSFLYRIFEEFSSISSQSAEAKLSNRE